MKSGGVHNLLGPNVKKEEKEKKLKEQKELAALFRPVQTQKIEPGTDPKSVVCAFFKQGQCTKGDRCKFSHDLSVERKQEKRSLYVDMRDAEKENDTMDTWNEDKLKEVVDKKHSAESNRPTTDIICKFFLDAVEKSKYGWFWECPNGGRCIYRHALPQGYVLKRDKKILDSKKPDISLVDLIERERAALGPKQTKITLETFIAWKKRKIEERKEKQRKEEEKKRNEFKSGKNLGLSGREMFSFNPEMAMDGDAMEDGDVAFEFQREADEDGADGGTVFEYKELDLETLGMDATEMEMEGATVAVNDRFAALRTQMEEEDKVEEEEEGASGGGGGAEGQTNGDCDTGAINENLFLDEDLEGLDEELNDLDVDDT